jgi:hypothetical protein
MATNRKISFSFFGHFDNLGSDHVQDPVPSGIASFAVSSDRETDLTMHDTFPYGTFSSVLPRGSENLNSLYGLSFLYLGPSGSYAVSQKA